MTEKTNFIIDGQVVEGELILEKKSTNKDDDFTNIQVYKLDEFKSAIPFEGTDTLLIEKEFPTTKFSSEEHLNLNNVYVMLKDGSPVIDGVD